MHLYVLAFCWFLLSWFMRMIVVEAHDRNLYDVNYEHASPETKRLIVLASVITLLYFPAVAMSFYYLYWAFVATLQG